jgi:hypothetical protein
VSDKKPDKNPTEEKSGLSKKFGNLKSKMKKSKSKMKVKIFLKLVNRR